jgi:hypothetical protein
MAGADTTTASSVLKEYFLPGVKEELNNSSMLLAQIDANSDDVEGDHVTAEHHIGRNAGIGARLEGETLPTPGAQGYARSNYYLYANYGVGRISTRLMKAIKTDRGAFTNAAKAEMTRIRDDLKREINFQAWGTSNGVIASLTDTASGNTVTLTTATDRRVFNYLHVGMMVDFGTVASPTVVASNRKITAINKTSRTVTVDGAAFDPDATTRMFRAGSGGAGVSQRVITGIQTIIGANNTYAGIDGSVVSEWNSYVSNVGGVLTEDVIAATMSEISMTGASVPDLVITTPEILRNIAQQLRADRVLNDPVTLKGGYKGVVIQTPWGDVTLTSDRDCPAGTCWFINTGELTQYQYADWDFLDEDGSVLHLVSGVAAYDFTLEKFHELATLSRRAHGVLTGITLS